MDSQDLWRATLHDFNNLLAGLQGVLDLSDPRLPLDGRNRQRLESTLEDGKTLIAQARALALGRQPDPGLAPWPEWQSGFEARLEPMSALYRCPVEVVDMGAAGAHWPAPQLQDWAAAFTRQVLPWAVPGPLRVEAMVTAEAWFLTWKTDAPVPVALKQAPSADAPRNLAAFWLRATGEQLGVAVEAAPEGLVVRLGRPGGS